MKETSYSPSRQEAIASFRADREEAERKRRLTPTEGHEIGRAALEGFVPNPQVTRLGGKLVEMAGLRTHRKEVRKARNDGLEKALDKRKAYAEKTKADLKFAKQGYGRRAKKAEVAAQTAQIRDKMVADRLASGQLVEPKLNEETKGWLERRAAKLDKRLQNRAYKKGLKQVKGDAKAFAKQAVKQQEQEANSRLGDYELLHREAKARVAQTRSARLKSRLRAGGNRANAISSFKDVNNTTENRLNDLKLKRAFNNHMNKGSFQKQRIAEANSALSEQAVSQRQEHFFGPEQVAEQPVSTAPEVNFETIADSVPGMRAALEEAPAVPVANFESLAESVPGMSAILEEANEAPKSRPDLRVVEGSKQSGEEDDTTKPVAV